MIGKNRSGWIIFSIILLILLIVSIGANIYFYTLPKEDNTEFFNSYVIAMNDYHTASELFSVAGSNLDYGNWYTETEGYYYESAIDYYDRAKEQLIESKELLTHAKLKLNNIKNDSPNEFYTKEINNRLEQINIFLSLVDQYYLLNDYMSKQLYEVNYGSKTEATRYYNSYNDLIPEVNENMKKLSDISQKIDLAWDQDWYPLFEGV